MNQPDAHDAGTAFEAWRRALIHLTRTEAAAREWRYARSAFRHRLGREIAGAATGPAVYGVWLEWGLVYLGQTLDARRRLYDLPIGDSHHLANTFPPEVWHRVVVTTWPELPAAADIGEMSPVDVGLGLEYGLQRRLRPLANAERRTSDGAWRRNDLDRSRSRGARAYDRVGPLVAAVERAWAVAGSADPGDMPPLPASRVILPGALLSTAMT
ncbi:hypothetical protein ACTMTJ_43880 [Phytohabitans sp. LJ34]|uniref:hypothetical protein n=1 Tax=Phytohabitans sp. LJ34 TaxID=3452217 RepID=UPI003F8C6322